MELDGDLRQKAEDYNPTAATLDPIRDVPLLFAVGISGAGKDTVLKRLVASHPDRYQFMVSYTTRKPRVNGGIHEQDGIDYHFIDFATAERMLDEGKFVEVNCYADNVYGTGVAEIAHAHQTGKTIIKDVDINGVINYERLAMNVKPVFILPPSYEVWWERLIVRYGKTIDQNDLRKRMKTALNELSLALEHKFFYLVINDDLEQTVQRIMDISQGRVADPRPEQAIAVVHDIMRAIERKLANA